MNGLFHLMQNFKPGRRLPKPGEKGQSLIILTFAFLGLIAMLGLALDLGLVYIERVRLKRTVDAATLAGVIELPVEEAAVTKAIGFLDSNGYKVSDINVYVAGCVQDVNDQYLAGAANYGTPGSDGSTTDLINLALGDINTLLPQATDTLTPTTDLFYPYIVNGDPADTPSFFIDTRSFQSRNDPTGLCDGGEQIGAGAADFGSANKIKITGQVPVRMNFMQFFGFTRVPVVDDSVAENASNLDVALVLDSTGSMEYDTICYGCWERCGDSSLIPSSECTSKQKYLPYPKNGRAFPFPYPARSGPQTQRQTRMANMIAGDDGDAGVWPPTPGTPDPDPGNDYIILEAEFYADNSSTWDPGQRPNGSGYWAIQRSTSSDGCCGGGTGTSDNGQALAIDGYGYEGTSGTRLNGLVRHHPMTENSDGKVQPFGRHYTQTDAENNISPRLEYDFVPTWGSKTYVHFKGQYYNGNNNNPPDNEFFWAIYDPATGNNVYPGPAGSTAVLQATGGAENDHWNPRPDRHWRWFSVNTGGLVLTPGRKYTLKIWAGSGGYALDRIIITARSNIFNPNNLTDDPATNGTAQRLAADPCNPIFGLNVVPTDCTYTNLLGPTDNINDSLFNAMNPMRGAQQAMRNFVARLDPNLDQAGFVDFDNDAGQVAQLECLRASRNRASAPNAPATQNGVYPFNPADGYPNYDEYECADPVKTAPGTVPISYTVVFKGIENAYPPGGGTDIADGLRRGLHMLGITTDNDGTQANNCEWYWKSSTQMWQIRQANGSGGTDQPTPNRNYNPSGHCGRGAAATAVIVLLTDGAPTNGTPGDNSDCRAWGASNPMPYESFPMGDDKYECIMYYADIAADNGVIVYTIGLGAGADANLLGAVADKTRGEYYFAPSAQQLNVIFDQILANVYIRLVQ